MKLLTEAAGIRNPVLPPSIGSGDIGTKPTGSLIGSLVGVFLIFAFLLAFTYLILGGISWITAGGDKGQLEAARNKITNALVGIIIVGGAWAVFTLVGGFLGLNFPNLELPVIGQ